MMQFRIFVLSCFRNRFKLFATKNETISNKRLILTIRKEMGLMEKLDTSNISIQIMNKAISLGASTAGIASVAALKQSPSYEIYEKIKPYEGVGSYEPSGKAGPGMVEWPPEARSAVVITLAHQENKPQLDWWDGNKGTEGNRILITIGEALAQWVKDTFNINTRHLSYHIEQGGIFIKDAAVMAGLGCMGKNNLVITPEFGPRVRFRALLLDTELGPTDPKTFNPCEECNAPCRQVCPQDALSNTIYSPRELEMENLPGRNGCYSRGACNIQMEQDIEAAKVLSPSVDKGTGMVVKYCRRCELECPVGQ